MMYSNAGYRNRIDMEIEDRNCPLVIESCGVYKLIQRVEMTTTRPEGRKDYQLLYVAEGKAFFQIEEGIREVRAGNMVLYLPGESQHYTYFLKDSPEVYWIHFTGYEAKEHLQGFVKGRGPSVLYVGLAQGYQQIFLKMIRELQTQKACFDELLVLYFRQMLAMVHRYSIERQEKGKEMPQEVERAVHYFHENFTADIEIHDYARTQHMSVCWFIRMFKQYMGVPPLQYITSIRIAKAKELLESTDYHVGEIALMAGYTNPLYFSRHFKKSTGICPVEFRRGFREKDVGYTNGKLFCQ